MILHPVDRFRRELGWIAGGPSAADLCYPPDREPRHRVGDDAGSAAPRRAASRSGRHRVHARPDSPTSIALYPGRARRDHPGCRPPGCRPPTAGALFLTLWSSPWRSASGSASRHPGRDSRPPSSRPRPSGDCSPPRASSSCGASSPSGRACSIRRCRGRAAGTRCRSRSLLLRRDRAAGVCRLRDRGRARGRRRDLRRAAAGGRRPSVAPSRTRATSTRTAEPVGRRPRRRSRRRRGRRSHLGSTA